MSIINNKNTKLNNLIEALNDFNENKDNLVKVYYLDNLNYTIKIINPDGVKIATFRQRTDRTASGRDSDFIKKQYEKQNGSADNE